MASEPGVVVTLDGQLRDPRTPLLHADDLAAVRGDGIFESLLVRDGRPCLLESHLGRLTQSARMMDLPEPDLSRWRTAIAAATAAWTERGGGEGVLRLIYSRGRESGSEPTAFAMIGAMAGRVAAARADGVAAVTVARSLPAEAASDMPWLLAGAKTLSYAVNMAALREAERRGADDVIFVSTDGVVLEAPTASVVWATDRTLRTTPVGPTGILPGTTQQLLFDRAAEAGWTTETGTARVDDLHAADTVWLISSVRGPVDVVELDGKGRSRDLPVLAEIARFAGFPPAAQ